MSTYAAPIKDMLFVLRALADIESIAGLPGCEDASLDTVTAVLEESGKFAAGVLDPLNWPGDQAGAQWDAGTVRMPDGFRAAYDQFVAAGWNALPIDPEWGGQGLPKVVSTPVTEMVTSANMAFSLCPLLTQGAIEALLLCGSAQLKETFLRKMVTGEWTGTMNLTEPQAGSDLALLRTKAQPQGDHYLITGQKIFITYGEHDLTDNIVHLVLARTPDAPEGVKGISLFVVPKFLVNADGSLGARNSAHCVSIEHKLGIHASPTAVMSYENAVGYLVGEENKGLAYMFIMMNAARFGVGMEGVAIAERAYQRAVHYARDRMQGKDLMAGAKTVPIIRHPDVRRMLMLMKSQTEAMRALAYVVAAAMDVAQRHPDADVRKTQAAFVDLMIPVVKAWSTETGIEVASLGVQIHGGMGFIEETGAAQYLRDARITTIYEGTTGIQANDLLGRKIVREGGASIRAWINHVQSLDATLTSVERVDVVSIRNHLRAALQAVSKAVDYILAQAANEPKNVFAGAVPFLKLVGITAGGWQMAVAALKAHEALNEAQSDHDFYQAKIATARFFAEQILVEAPTLSRMVTEGGASVMALDEAMF